MKKFTETLVFVCNGEELSLSEIRKKKVNSVTVCYDSEPIEERAPGVLGLLGKKIIKREKKEFTIENKEGIDINLSICDSLVIIRFYEEADWKKVIEYDKNTLFKRHSTGVCCPCQINFLSTYLKNISWE